MNLYQIQQEHLSIINVIEEGGGEVNDEIQQALQLTEEGFVQKATSIGYVLKHLEDNELIIKKEIERIGNLLKRNNKGYDYLKDRLKEAMVQFDVEKNKN